MISAYAQGYQVLGQEEYRTAAEQAADFILTRMRTSRGLLHAHRADRSLVDGYLDDYAFFIQALLDLYESTFDIKWINQARALADEMVGLFWDDEAGGFYFSAKDQPHTIVWSKKGYDGAVPSGNAIAAFALLRLAKLTHNEGYFDKAERTLAAFAASAERVPGEFAQLLCSIDFYLGPIKEIAILGPPHASTNKLLEAVRKPYLPNKVVAMIDPASPIAATIAETLPLLEAKRLINDKATAYVCEGYKCYAPVTSVSELEKILAER